MLNKIEYCLFNIVYSILFIQYCLFNIVIFYKVKERKVLVNEHY